MKILNFGCRINTYEGAVMQTLSQDVEGVAIVNTCAVTAEAERQCKQAIRRLKKENPEVKIIVTGCAAQLHPEVYLNLPQVDRVVGNREKLEKETLFGHEKCAVSDITNIDFPIPVVSEFEGRVRAFLQIQQGCDHGCTFCIVHFVRGSNKGVPVERVIEMVKSFVQKGYAEVVLTGIDLTSYPYGFSELAEKILDQVPDLKRLRLGSLDPAGVDEKLIALFGKEERLMPHIHFSIQSGDDMILKRMGRRHTREEVIEKVGALRAVRPDMVFGSDFITGFPTETDEQFQNTMDLVKETGLTLLHVFPFSVRPKTASARMPMVPVEIRKKRAAELRGLGKMQLDTYLHLRIGKKETVLVEEKGIGLNTHYIKTHVPADIPVGAVVDVVNQGVKDNELVAAP